MAQRAGGTLLLILVTVGLAGYALWRLSEAAFGVAGDGKGAGPRLQSLARGVVYVALAVSALNVVDHPSHQQSQSREQQTLSARLMHHTGGRLLLGTVGLVVAIVGLAMVYEGVSRRFERLLRLGDMSSKTRSVVVALGAVGTTARGLVFATTGGLVIAAAATGDSAKASGLDGALRTLAHQPYGAVLLCLAGTGLMVFGAYGIAEARWHKT